MREGLDSLGPSPQTVFRAGIDGRMVDLTEAPFKRARSEWTDPDKLHRFATLSLKLRAGRMWTPSATNRCAIRSTAGLSRCCGLLVSSRVKPLEQRIWLLTVRPEAAIWQREGQSHEFLAKDWKRLTAG